MLMYVSIVIKSSTLKLLNFAVLLIYVVIISYLKLLLAFIFSLYTNDVILVYHSLFYKDVIYAITVVIIIFVYIGIKFTLSDIDLRSYQFLFLTYGIEGFLLIIVFQNRLLVLQTSRIFETLMLLAILLISIALLIAGSIIHAKQREQIVALQIYNKMMQDKYHEIEKIYREFAYVNHDIKNHLIILEKYEENGEHEKALNYIKKIQIPLSQNISRYIKTGHDVIDIILNFKLKEAEKMGISIDTDCEVLPDWGIDDSDLCSILGNLIDNAINACSKINNRDSWIKFSLHQKGNILLLQISNSCLSDNKNDCKEDFLHGYGLDAVKSKVEKYAGHISIVSQENVYIVVINFII